ncbi:IPT/TIG domain-containing protein [Actinomadura barringtoniae]|uniref:IPT/TIG domain-containing protein n=1 Tax=Actinomadura barringtoniae TaxID=1427535 RepID=A0A939P607_9ACTN|nr:IPT/TIG domain-containing protein [Actinomadura barringtoniae]MBO2445710.1 IPT/TIG domain-containing protein [Actinomadura barringtoniae]
MGSDYARARHMIAVAVPLVLLAVVLVFMLVQAWPPSPVKSGESPPTGKDLHLFGWTPRVSRETGLFIIVLAAGGLGGTVHALRSLYWYVGNRTLRRSWLMMYLILPFIGAALGLVVYMVLRGGLTSPTGGSDINPYGVTAIAALVGLFSQETAEKLRAVFETLLTPAKAGRDQALPPQVRALEPVSGPVGALLTVRGLGLGSATVVRFGTVDAPATDVTDTELTVTVPPGATTGRPAVITPVATVASPVEFTVEDGPANEPPGQPEA